MLRYSDKIESIHCFVGKNGSGKTRLINDILTQGGKIVELSYDNLENTSILKYSASIELEQLGDLPEHSFDVSTSSLLKRMSLISLHRLDSIFQVKVAISHYGSLKDIINFSNKELLLKLTEAGEGLREFRNKYFHGSQYYENIKEFINSIIESQRNTEFNRIVKVLVIKFLSVFMDHFILSENVEDNKSCEIQQLFQEINLKTLKPRNKFYTLLEDSFGYSKSHEDVKKLEDFFEMLNRFIKLEKNSFDLSANSRRLLNNILKMIMISHYDNFIAHEVFSIIEFKWNGLSSGELALLNLFARLNTFRNGLNGDVVVLIDEIDLGMHPEWQRRWVKDVLPVIGSIMKTEENSVHVLFTTHSPIILSDLLEKDIIYLSDQSNSLKFKTFGQNIYNLFQDSFYLKDSKGSFSMDVIRSLLSLFDNSSINGTLKIEDIELMKFSETYDLNFENRTTDEIRIFFEKLVDMIGEDIIRNHLKIQLERVEWGGSERQILEYERKITMYQEKIRKLREGLE